MTTTGKLSALKVAKAKEPGYYGDGMGLWLQVSKAGTKSWVLRYTSPVTGKAREMGLGSLLTFSLAEARERAQTYRKLIAESTDPLQAREAERERIKAEAAKLLTFDECAEACIRAKEAGWRNAKHKAQWRSTLATYASPSIGTLPAAAVDRSMVFDILDPIWRTKPETASRLRGRIEAVLAWAAVREGRDGYNNPARWDGQLEHLLPAMSKVRQVKHHAALPYAQAGAFMVELRQQAGMAALALQFAILTATRSGEVRGAVWSEFDLVEKLWVIPAGRMKAAKEHRVPLSGAALALLRALPRLEGTETVFFSPSGGKLSDMSLTAVLRRMGRGGDLTAHGFRSTFRDWAAETTAYPREVVEHALAHRLKDKAEAAYQRGDLLVKRAKLMQAWADHLDRAGVSGEVIEFKAA